MLLLRRLAYLEQHIDTCLYAWYQRKMLVINSVFDFEPETAGYHLSHLEPSSLIRLKWAWHCFRNCKISAHLGNTVCLSVHGVLYINVAHCQFS